MTSIIEKHGCLLFQLGLVSILNNELLKYAHSV